MLDNINAAANSDSLELIEEHLTAQRTSAVCQTLVQVCQRIWGISIRNCVISDSDFEKLLRAMKKCKLLRYLNFNINFITTSERLNQLTTLLTSLKYLDTLCLHSSYLNDDGLKLLYYSLANLKNLRSLDIGDCGLSDQSVDYIREIIRRREHLHGLVELILSYNPNITPIGWSKILIAVAASADLKYLYIDYNTLDDSCGYLLVAAICSNQSLEILDLEHTGLTDKTALLLEYLLKNYKNGLKSLNLMKNKIDDDLADEIASHINNLEPVFGDTTAVITRIPNKLDPSSLDHPKKSTKRAEMKIRDELKIADYVKQAHEYQKTQPASQTDYEKLLERDYNSNNSHVQESHSQPAEREESRGQATIVLRPPNKDKSAVASIVATAANQENKQHDDSNEYLKVYEDQRFKTHTVMPFNLK